jgi:hypothetical protein
MQPLIGEVDEDGHASQQRHARLLVVVEFRERECFGERQVGSISVVG